MHGVRGSMPAHMFARNSASPRENPFNPLKSPLNSFVVHADQGCVLGLNTA